VAVKIKLKRIGKIRNPQYRIVVADARAKRDGRAIEEIGIYQPKQDPSLIRVDSARVQYWLSVGAQPTEAVAALLKVTGDWQTFKGLPGAEGTLRVAEPKVDKTTVFATAVEAAAKAGDAPAKPRSAKKAEQAAAETDLPAAEAEVAAIETAADVVAEEATELAAAEAEVAADAPADAGAKD
jgi:small subunit ribosomal protein S16